MMSRRGAKYALTAAVAGLLAGLLLAGIPAASQEASPASRVTYPVQLSGPLSVGNLPSQTQRPAPPREIPLYRPPVRPRPGTVADPVLQTSTSTAATAQTLGQWEGLGEGYPGFTVTAVPPDPNIAVGPNHIVQWVNNALVIFDKQGRQVQAPVSDSTFWGVLSTCYQGGGFSDPIIQYDRAADRWLVGEVAIPLLPPLIGQYAQCFAVSKTSDPTFVSDANGNNTSYYIWAYGFGTNINDYPKIGVWPDGYYVTWNIFQNGTTFTGPEVCAWKRTDMLNGVSAPAFVCFQLSSPYASLLPSDLDGATAPPAGSPNFLLDIDPSSGALNLWKFHVDFTNTKNSTFTGPTSIAGVALFTAPCLNTQDCIPQPGTTRKLDALGDRLMYRLAYRNFGDHESIVANHTVLTAGGNTGVRWYEVRSPNGTAAIYQQGTFAPDTDNRWMGSIAMDQAGNIGVGYSVASSATYPSIRYTGWQVGNSLGTLQAETSLVAGGGSQTGYNRWGDYSAMRIDPSDDCTLWYTQEYQATTQSADWNTRIGSFKFSSCGQALTSTTTTLASSPNPSTYGQLVTFTATLTLSSGTITPTGSVTFKDGSTILGSSTLDLSGVATFATSSLASGSHSITAVYSGDSNYSSSTSSVLTQIVSQASTSTTLTSSLNPSTYGTGVTFTATVSPATATGTAQFFDGTTSLGTASLSGGTASQSTSALSVGTHTLTATYSGDSNFTGSTSNAVTQTVNPGPTDFSISTSPTSQSVKKGRTASYTVAVTSSGGFTGSVTLTATVTPTGPRTSFSPSTITGGSGTSTLRVSTSGVARTTYTITITGTSGSLTHSTSVTLTVR
jgi:Bacterial Ig-like domain (group 3)